MENRNEPPVDWYKTLIWTILVVVLCGGWAAVVVWMLS